MDRESDPSLDEIDATDLVIDEAPADDDDSDYDEMIILDLRRLDRHDLWLD